MFFDEIKTVEISVKQLKTDLNSIKDGVDGQFDQLDDIAAHIIAIEAVLVEVLKTASVDADAIKKWIVKETTLSTDNDGGSTKTQTIVDGLLAGGVPKI
jgi:hypothetical protein